MANDDSSGMKSAYELALERLEQRGIEKPRQEGLSEAVRTAIGEARAKAKAKKAELEIFHRERLAKVLDPAEKQREEAEYRADLARVEGDCERQVERLRSDQ